MKQQRPSTEANREAARRCFEIYGADIAKWPVDKRDAYGALAHSSELADELAETRDEAAMLDGFLNAATTSRASHDLKNRIKAAIDLPSRAARTNNFAALLSRWRLAPSRAPSGRASSGIWAGAGAGLWVSLAAGIGALGLASGFLTANNETWQGLDYQTAEYEAPEYEAYAYLEYSDGIFAQEEDVQWDVD